MRLKTLPQELYASCGDSPALTVELQFLSPPDTLSCLVQAVFHAERGLEWVVFAQKHQNPLVTAAANWSCATVTVVFYATFLPILVCARLPMRPSLQEQSAAGYNGKRAQGWHCLPRQTAGNPVRPSVHIFQGW